MCCLSRAWTQTLLEEYMNYVLYLYVKNETSVVEQKWWRTCYCSIQLYIHCLLCLRLKVSVHSNFCSHCIALEARTLNFQRTFWAPFRELWLKIFCLPLAHSARTDWFPSLYTGTCRSRFVSCSATAISGHCWLFVIVGRRASVHWHWNQEKGVYLRPAEV